MKYNQYYNKETMNIKQLDLDLKKQNYICRMSEDGNNLLVNYYWSLGYAHIRLSPSNDWFIAYYQPFKEAKFYKASTNWEVVKLLKKLLIESIKN